MPDTQRPAAERPIEAVVAAFLAGCQSSNTRAAYRGDLGDFAAWCRQGNRTGLLGADAADMAAYQAHCERRGLAASTIARRLSAIASLRTYAARDGRAPASQPDAQITRPRVAAASTSEHLDDSDAASLIAAADSASPRSAVAIRLLMLDGLKLSETITADMTDLAGAPPRVRLAVNGRSITLHPDTAVAIRRYAAGRSSGPLLLSERRGRTPERLTRFGLDQLVKHTVAAAGLPRGVSANALRRRYVLHARERGVELTTIQHNLGHAHPRTTQRYFPGGASLGNG